MSKNKLLIIDNKFNETLNLFGNEKWTIVNFSSQDFSLKINVKNNVTNIINMIAIVQTNDTTYTIDYLVTDQQNKITINIFFIVLNQGKINSTIIIKNTSTSKNNNIDMRAYGLILDNESKIIIKPIFNFLSNQIDAKHSVKIGTININELNYLKTRGIKRSTAELILIQSKINNILKYVEEKQKNKIMIKINEIIGK